MPMNKFDTAIHRTLVDYLIHTKQVELAAVMLDGEVTAGYEWDDFGNACFERYYLDIPTKANPLIDGNKSAQDALAAAIRNVAGGQQQTMERLTNIPAAAFPVVFRVKMLPVEEGWEHMARSLIANPKGANQAMVSDLASDGRPLHRWNELRYASASEIRIAQELERRKVLFFPLAVAVRAETGKNWQDHREVDFLICDNGTWGILEVAYHPDRYEKDAEKDLWFKKSGILCIQHVTAERCYNESAKVVTEFLSVLAQHKK